MKNEKMIASALLMSIVLVSGAMFYLGYFKGISDLSKMSKIEKISELKSKMHRIRNEFDIAYSYEVLDYNLDELNDNVYRMLQFNAISRTNLKLSSPDISITIKFNSDGLILEGEVITNEPNLGDSCSITYIQDKGFNPIKC